MARTQKKAGVFRVGFLIEVFLVFLIGVKDFNCFLIGDLIMALCDQFLTNFNSTEDLDIFTIDIACSNIIARDGLVI